MNKPPSPPWKPSHQGTFFLFGNSFERCRSSQRVPIVPQRLQNEANDRQTFGRLGGRFRQPKSATCLPLSGSCFGRPKVLKVTQNGHNDGQTFGRLDGRFLHPKSATCLPLSGSGFGFSGHPKAVQGRQTESNHRQTFGKLNLGLARGTTTPYYISICIHRRLGAESSWEIVWFRSCVRAVWFPGAI